VARVCFFLMIEACTFALYREHIERFAAIECRFESMYAFKRREFFRLAEHASASLPSSRALLLAISLFCIRRRGLISALQGSE